MREMIRARREELRQEALRLTSVMVALTREQKTVQERLREIKGATEALEGLLNEDDGG